jgi:saccharopine dehydrogenase-like NADP-dependent oxidoreductase
MKRNVLIIGAGGVGAVTAHKCAQNNDLLGDICIASKTIQKCERIIKSIHKKNNIENQSKKLCAKEIDARNTKDVAELIEKTNSEIVLNVGTPFVNMAVMDACLQAGAAYVDTGVHEEQSEELNMPYPWYANYEWKKKKLFQEQKLTAVLGAGFDPGVVNAYCAYAIKHEFDEVAVIDILDVNAGDHGKFFATNFDPEINLTEILEDAGYWEDRQWKTCPHHSKSMTYEFPVVGKHRLYLMGHDEIHSLSVHLDVDTIRFWMGFSDHYINCFTILGKIGLLSRVPVKTAEGLEVSPLKVVKACLPNPITLASNYTGKTCIGNLVKGKKRAEKKKYSFTTSAIIKSVITKSSLRLYRTPPEFRLLQLLF